MIDSDKVINRCVWIDYAKFFSIYLVVMFHVYPQLLSDGFIGNFLNLLRMPAFFLIAGFLFRIEKFNSFSLFLKHRSRQLLIPYISFFIIFYLLWIVVGRSLVGEKEMAIDILLPIKELICGTPNIICAPYWFITCLFSVQLIYFFIKKVIPDKYIFALSIVLSVLSVYVDDADFWMLNKAFKYMPFYAFANNYKTLISALNFTNNRYLVVICTSLVIVGLHFVEGNIFYNNNILLYITLSLLILPLYISSCKYISYKIGTNKYIELFAKNAIIILALQNYVIGLLKIISEHLIGYNICEYSILLNVLIAFVVILILYYPIILINKYVPFIIGRAYGHK